MIEEPKQLTVKNKRNRPTAEQIEAFKDVQTGFVVDAMHGAGALQTHIAPLDPTNARTIYGPALTVENGPADILATLGALTCITPGDIVISSVEAHQGCAAAGDRVTGMMKNCGAIGFVTDGPMRDFEGIKAVGLPCWCTGLNPGSPFSKGPGKIGFPISLGGQAISSGDMIVADRDGVVVVPFAQIDQVLAALENVKRLETELDAEVAAGLKVPQAILELMESEEVDYRD
ncbi:MAG: RraA family protein [Pseudomonadota bacterium]